MVIVYRELMPAPVLQGLRWAEGTARRELHMATSSLSQLDRKSPKAHELDHFGSFPYRQMGKRKPGSKCCLDLVLNSALAHEFRPALHRCMRWQPLREQQPYRGARDSKVLGSRGALPMIRTRRGVPLEHSSAIHRASQLFICPTLVRSHQACNLFPISGTVVLQLVGLIAVGPTVHRREIEL